MSRPHFDYDSPRSWHVSAISGHDSSSGREDAPLRTIMAAARCAQPGDTVVVHAGIYRECITPPRGGESDLHRITYQAAEGERVEIKGSEVAKDWKHLGRGVWTVELPASFFGSFNPFADELRGDWFNPKGRVHHSGAVYLNGIELKETGWIPHVFNPSISGLWTARIVNGITTIWAAFGEADPNTALAEVNVRRAVFYPERPEINYITVRGFVMCHAATPWAPPTAEQIGLIGTHWSRGWIIEQNEISHSRCAGVTLGKYGDEYDNSSQDSAEGYLDTVKRALQHGWEKGRIGGHLVRNNEIHHCEQAGIAGSLGACFSSVVDNHIHHIHQQQEFEGAEQAAIKFHGAVDTLIANNRIHHSFRGIWLDWMNQGTRVSGNLCHDNDMEDLFVEVNHGPFVVDHNLFLSKLTLFDRSQGGAYVHNLMGGFLWFHNQPPEVRVTPFLHPHSTRIAGIHENPGGDNRFISNLVLDRTGLENYLSASLPVLIESNRFILEAPVLNCNAEGCWLSFNSGTDVQEPRGIVTSECLGCTAISKVPFEAHDGSPLRFDTDYFGLPRDRLHASAGPFEKEKSWESHPVWPRQKV